MSDNGFLYLEKKYLEEIINFSASKLVGKVLKRFEIAQDREFIKKEAKELIYESFRDFRDILIAYDKGLEVSTFNFRKKGKKLSSE